MAAPGASAGANYSATAGSAPPLPPIRSSPVVPDPMGDKEKNIAGEEPDVGAAAGAERQRVLEIAGREADGGRRCALAVCGTALAGPPLGSGRGQIGRASCRERV